MPPLARDLTNFRERSQTSCSSFFAGIIMPKKAGHKATKKFAKSGQLKKTIQARHRHRDVKKRIDRKKAVKSSRENARGTGQQNNAAGSDESDDEKGTTPARKDGKKTK